MARIHARRSFSGRRSPGRLTEWIALQFASDATALAANSTVLFASLNAAALAKRPFTIVRVVGSMFVQSDQNAAIENPFGAFGLAVVSAEASAVGVTAVPDPVTTPESDLWMGYQSFAAEGSASTNVGRPANFQTFDFRAMRKVDGNSDFVTVVANSSAADGLLFILNYRFLVKLS